MVHFLLAILIQLIVPWIGRQSYNLGYLNIEEMGQRSLGFNLLLRAMSSSVFIVLFSVLLYLQDHSSIYIQNIWLVSVYYLFINLIVIFLTRGFIAESKASLSLYLIAHAASIYISFLLYRFYISKGLSELIPNAADFRTEIWLIIILFLYKVFNQIEFMPSGTSLSSLEASWLRKYKVLREKYSEHLNPIINNNNCLRLLFFSIAIYEDLNRNWFHRFLERIFFRFLKNKTTGVMQVHSKSPLSDLQSVKAAEKILLQNYERIIHVNKDIQLSLWDRAVLKRLLRGYNTRNYSDQVIAIFGALIEHLPLPEATEEKINWLLDRSSHYFSSYQHEIAWENLLRALRIDPQSERIFNLCLEKIGTTSYVSEDNVDRLLMLKHLLENEKNALADQKLLESRIKQIDAILVDLDNLALNPREFGGQGGFDLTD